MVKKRAAGLKADPCAKPARRKAAKAPAPPEPVAPEPSAPEPDAQPAPKAPPAAPALKVIAPTVKKKQLLERVAKATGGNKKQIREVVEATLIALGEALSKGEELNLPPFGKLKVNRQHERSGGEMMTLKLRRGSAKADATKSPGKQKAAKEPLAEDRD